MDGEGRRLLLSHYAFLFGLAASIVVLDQLSKRLVAMALSSGKVLSFGQGSFTIDYTRNSGAAFGILKSGGALFAIVALLVAAGIVLYHWRVASQPLVIRTGLALVLGGAIGNLIDRLRLGYVVDFIDFGWWPAFNLADSSIVLGVALLLIYSLFKSRPTLSNA